MLTDPISNFLIRIQNASRARKTEITVKASRMIKAIAKVLKEKGFIKETEEIPPAEGKNYEEIKITLNLDGNTVHVKRISKPGQRIYVGYKEIKPVRNRLGLALISTSRGVISDGEARKQKIGGEYICEVY